MDAKQWNVHRRYRDFASLVAGSPTAASHRALLPPKLWIESGAGALRHPQLLERRAALDALLQALAADLNAKPAVVDAVRFFAAPPEQLTRVARARRRHWGAF